jgi:hypothetical protein
MFDFGLFGYRPRWLSGIDAIASAHAHALGSVVGRTLSSSWLVWDLDDNEWFADCPVLLDFDGIQVEVNHKKFDHLSITWNEIDPLAPVDWPGGDYEFHLAWRSNAVVDLAALHGRRVTGVELLEWAGSDMASGMVAVSFVLGDGRVSIYNALDENGLAFDPPEREYRVHKL